MNKKRFDYIIEFLDFDSLDDWQQRFIDSLSDQFERKGSLSLRQEEVLENIFTQQQLESNDDMPF